MTAVRKRSHSSGRRTPKAKARRRAGAVPEGDDLARRIEAAHKRLRPLLPEIDDQTLVTILSSVLQPFGTGKRFFLRARPDGGFIF